MTFTTEARRARLVARQHLDGSAADPLQAADDVVVLHATDPATVYLSVLARCSDAALDDVSRAMYDDRRLVRMLAMRRTLFVVPVELAPVVHHAAGLGIAAQQRRLLVKQLRTIPTDPPVPDDVEGWLDDVESSVERALAARGEALANALSTDEPRLAHLLPAHDRQGVRRQAHHHLPGAHGHGRRGADRARRAARRVARAAARLAARDVVVARRAARGAGCRGAPRRALPEPVRPGHRRRRAVVDGLGRGSHAGRARGARHRRRGVRARARRRRRARRAARRRPRRCCRPWIRRRWAGRSADGSSPRIRRRSTTGPATSARPCGGAARSSAAGRSAPTAASRPGSSSIAAPTPSGRWRRPPTPSRLGSAAPPSSRRSRPRSRRSCAPR